MEKFIFSQVTDFLNYNEFNYLTIKYIETEKPRVYSYWNQLLLMMIGQLTECKSLDQVLRLVNAIGPGLNNLGLGSSIKHSNTFRANSERDVRVFQEYAEKMIKKTVEKYNNKKFFMDSRLYAVDSTIVDLCLTVFLWAKYKKTKGGIKAHVVYDVINQIPNFIYITPAAVNDMKVMPMFPYETGATYIFDRGYNDFKNLNIINEIGANFVIRGKKNLCYKVIEWTESNDEMVFSDTIIRLRGRKTSKQYPEKLRKVDCWVCTRGHVSLYSFLTNNFEASPQTIAGIYRQRWQIELFFKWLKQHLNIQRFWGQSENAVKIQIYCAIITYCLIANIRFDMKLEKSMAEILHLIGKYWAVRKNLRELLDDSYRQRKEEQSKYGEGYLFK